jgi:hypothetical protein
MLLQVLDEWQQRFQALVALEFLMGESDVGLQFGVQLVSDEEQGHGEGSTDQRNPPLEIQPLHQRNGRAKKRPRHSTSPLSRELTEFRYFPVRTLYSAKNCLNFSREP